MATSGGVPSPPPSTAADRRAADVDVLSERISRLALRHYRAVLPPKGKPQPGKEWTCYAAVVAVHSSSCSHHDSSSAQGRPTSTSSIQNDAGAGDANDMWVISAATGSKCVAVSAAADALPCRPCNSTCCCGGPLPIPAAPDAAKTDTDTDQAGLCKGSIRGAVLHDSHAEVLARRGLVRVLWAEVEALLLAMAGDDDAATANNDEHQRPSSSSSSAIFGDGYRPLLQRKGITNDDNDDDDDGNACHLSSTPPLFELRPDISLHLYISDSPCGDASIYPIGLRYRPPPQRERPLPEESNDGETPPKKRLVNGLDGSNGSDNKRQKIDAAAAAPAPSLSDLSFTGAKIVVSNQQHQGEQRLGALLPCGDGTSPKGTDTTGMSTTFVAREGQQILGALRTKSGRSNLPAHLRSTSMSCSDKLCRWSVLGMQGSLLSRYLPDPIVPASVVVGRDPRCCGEEGDDGQRAALERAICQRAEAAQSCLAAAGKGVEDQLCALPNVYIARDAFDQGKASSEKVEVDARAAAKNAANDNDQGTNLNRPKKSGKKSLSPCGFCVNWQRVCNDSMNSSGNNCPDAQAIEMVIGAKGIKQGKKPKQPVDVIKVTSRLCRFELQMRSAIRCSHLARKYASDGIDVLKRSDKKLTYQEAKAKSICKDRARRKSIFDDGWVSSSKAADFVIPATMISTEKDRK